MPRHRIVIPSQREPLGLPFEALIIAGYRQRRDHRRDNTISNESRNMLINPSHSMRAIGWISAPQFIPAVAAEHDFHMLRRDARQQIRRQDRWIGHRLVEAIQRAIESIDQIALAEGLLDMPAADVPRDETRESA